MPVYRYMLVDRDGHRIGRYETSQIEWPPGSTFEYEGQRFEIIEILPEVSTAVAYLGVWVVAPTASY